MNAFLRIADARCFNLRANDRWLLFPWGPFGRGYDVPPGALASRARSLVRGFFPLELLAATLLVGVAPTLGWSVSAGWPWLLWMAVLGLRGWAFARLTEGMGEVRERLGIRQFLVCDLRAVLPEDTGYVREALAGSLLYGTLFLVTRELGFGFDAVDGGWNGALLRLSVLGGVLGLGLYPQVVFVAAASLWVAPSGLAHDVVIVGWLCVWAWGLWLLRDEGRHLAS